MTEEERKDGYAVHGRFAEQLGERGHTHRRRRRAPAGLRRSTHHRSPARDSVTDGPVGGDQPSRSAATTRSSTDDLDDLWTCCRILAATGDAVRCAARVMPEEGTS